MRWRETRGKKKRGKRRSDETAGAQRQRGGLRDEPRGKIPHAAGRWSSLAESTQQSASTAQRMREKNSAPRSSAHRQQRRWERDAGQSRAATVSHPPHADCVPRPPSPRRADHGAARCITRRMRARVRVRAHATDLWPGHELGESPTGSDHCDWRATPAVSDDRRCVSFALARAVLPRVSLFPCVLCCVDLFVSFAAVWWVRSTTGRGIWTRGVVPTRAGSRRLFRR